MGKPSLPQFDPGVTEEQRVEKLRMFVDELTRWIEETDAALDAATGEPGYPPELGHAKI
jgi:hypothetical protein